MIHLGSVGKTSIDVDISFLIVVGLWVATAYNESAGWRYALLWAPVLFVSVLIHEFAHAAAIALFGYGRSAIVLSGMGGATYNKRIARPWHDVVISVVGPLSSFALVVVALILINTPISRDPMMSAFLPTMVRANFLWGMFNLVPVSPLDGGHAVRNFFRMFLNEQKAFAVSVWIAIIIGGGIAVYWFLNNLIFVGILLAWYVYLNFQQWQYFRSHGHPGD